MAADSRRHPTLREHALHIATDGLECLASDALHARHAGESRYDGVERVFTVATGKAAARATVGLRRGVPPELLRGSITVDHVDRTGDPADPQVTVLRGDHPLPGPASVDAARRIAAVVRSWHLDSRDLVVVSVSGGTSALIASPRPPVTLDDLRSLGATLLRSGVDVTRVNSVRRRISVLHDGGLLRALRPARVRTVLVSDVAQSSLPGVGSGPTLPDPVPLDPEVLRLVEDPDLRARVAAAVTGAPAGTDTSDEVHVLAGIQDYTRSCVLVAERRGLVTCAPRPVLQGTWNEVADMLWARARALAVRVPSGRPLAVVGCGECTVAVRPGGTGGRCQQVALAVAARAPAGTEFAFAGFASDGRDNLDGVRGAVVDHTSTATWPRSDLERALEHTDGHALLRRAGCLVTGGPTGENLGDAYVLCLRAPGPSPAGVRAG